MDSDTKGLFMFIGVFCFLLVVLTGTAIFLGSTKQQDKEIIHVKFDKVDVAELADALRLERSTHGEYAGSSPVIDNRRIEMKKEWKHYENNEGKVVLAYYGLSRPMNEIDPFVYGYWVSLDLNGSEQFIPKPEFEKEYREIK